eukprot:6212359-Pleurochrysis_carterae.AAC.1
MAEEALCERQCLLRRLASSGISSALRAASSATLCQLLPAVAALTALCEQQRRRFSFLQAAAAITTRANTVAAWSATCHAFENTMPCMSLARYLLSAYNFALLKRSKPYQRRVYRTRSSFSEVA